MSINNNNITSQTKHNTTKNTPVQTQIQICRPVSNSQSHSIIKPNQIQCISIPDPKRVKSCFQVSFSFCKKQNQNQTVFSSPYLSVFKNEKRRKAFWYTHGTVVASRVILSQSHTLKTNGKKCFYVCIYVGKARIRKAKKSRKAFRSGLTCTAGYSQVYPTHIFGVSSVKRLEFWILKRKKSKKHSLMVWWW